MAAILVLLVALACAPGPTTAPPTLEPAAVEQPLGLVLGCASIDEAECQLEARRLLADLPAGRGHPFDIQISPGGITYVEYAGGVDTLTYTIGGDPFIVGPLDFTFSDPLQPSSAGVVGVGPFAFDLGHCGLSHMVDFDGSFWVAFGQIDGEAPGWINSESGQMRLVGPNVAEYRGSIGFVARLVRFPGAKRFFLCD
jgi:hypothetical protein